MIYVARSSPSQIARSNHDQQHCFWPRDWNWSVHMSGTWLLLWGEQIQSYSTSDPVHRLRVWLQFLGGNQWFKVPVQCCIRSLFANATLSREDRSEGEGPMLHFADTLLIWSLLLQLITLISCSSWPIGYHGSFGIRVNNLDIEECLLFLFQKPLAGMFTGQWFSSGSTDTLGHTSDIMLDIRSLISLWRIMGN